MTNEIVNTPALVELQPVNGKAQPVTTSLRVAEYFEKEHKNVLRDIKETISKCSESFSALNFELAEYTDEQGKERPMYLLTRDGFMVVAMGYTGEKAMQLKEAYIGAFNEMEQRLLSNRRQYDIADAVNAARLIFEAAQIEGNQLALAMDKIYRREMGFSALTSAEVALVAPKQEQLYTPTELGRMLTPALSPKQVNRLLHVMGYQYKTGDKWNPTPDGKAAGAVLLDTNKRYSDGTPIRQLKWSASIIEKLQADPDDE